LINALKENILKVKQVSKDFPEEWQKFPKKFMEHLYEFVYKYCIDIDDYYEKINNKDVFIKEKVDDLFESMIMGIHDVFKRQSHP